METLVLHSDIGSRIFTIKGELVMLDRDIAELYKRAFIHEEN